MKQLIIRVSPDLHRRIAARAAREGTSVNAWVRDLLDVVVDADLAEDRQARAKAKAAELGMLVKIDAPRLTPEERDEGKRAWREIGADVVRILEEDRSTGL